MGFAAFKNHLSFYVMSPDLVRARAADIEGYDASGATIHFSPDRPLPPTLVTKLVKARIAENEKRVKKKQERNDKRLPHEGGAAASCL